MAGLFHLFWLGMESRVYVGDRLGGRVFSYWRHGSGVDWVDIGVDLGSLDDSGVY